MNLAFRTDERDAALAPLRAEYDSMLACIRCGLCLTSCPTYVLSLHESEGPRGRVGMMRALAEGHLAVTPDLVEHELNCLVCDACSAVCPAGIHMDPMQVGLRAAIEPGLRARRSPAGRLVRWLAFDWLFPDMGHFRLLARLLWLYQRSGLRWLARRLGVLRLLRLADAERLLPRVPTRFLVPAGETYPAERRDDAPPATAPRVAFFAGCVMSTALADVDAATLRVLQRAGFEVRDPAGQGCCGALNAHGGDLDGARALARRVVAAFEGDDPVVVNSAGCGAMLKDYAHHLRDDPAWAERARAFSARVRDLSEVLAERPLPIRRGVRGPLVYQDACHLLHAQRVSRQPRDLLRRLPDADLREIAEPGLCCGSAGVYNVTNPREATALGDRKVANILAAAPATVVTANPGCLLHLRARLAEAPGGERVAVRHLADVLAEATRR